MQELLTAEDVARILGIHPKTVYALAADGRLPAARLGRRSLRFRPEDVERFVDERRVPAEAVG